MAVNGFFILRLLGTAAPGISRLAAAAYVMVMILGVFAALRPTLRVHAGLAARRAELASRAVAERDAVAALGEDRRDRLALLEVEALPLLRGIADGSLDPDDEQVRQACARHATTLRRPWLTGPGWAASSWPAWSPRSTPPGSAACTSASRWSGTRGCRPATGRRRRSPRWTRCCGCSRRKPSR